MTRQTLLVLVVASALVAGAAAAVLAFGTGADERPARAPARTADLLPCRGLTGEAANACYADAFLAIVRGQDDPRPVVERIAEQARSRGGSLLSNCHGIMHTVGRTYAGEAGLTLATLMDRLPRSNDPGCTAGFAHGMVTAVAPDIDPTRPGEAARVCGGAETRYQNYSCIHGFGHAFMRIYGDRLEPALKLCRALGPRAAPDCAQGAYHDYWFAVAGADDASLSEPPVTDPRELCGAQPAGFVRPCWYRAYVENRPEAFDVAAPEDLDALCYELTGLQREACITAASVIGPPDPAAQLKLCAGLTDPSDAASCVRGTKVQNLLGSDNEAYVELIERCDLFAGATRAACYRWLGKTIAVLTDGEFAHAGCPRLAAPARRHCRAGASRMGEALVTFS